MKRKLICLLAAAVTAVSLPATVFAYDEVIFIEDETTGEVTTDIVVSEDKGDNDGKDSKEDKDDKNSGNKTTGGVKKSSENKTGGVDKKETVNPFKDIAKGSWYYDYVLDVYEKGLMAGTADDMFSPDSTLTRGMVASIVYRMEGSPRVEYKTLFTDIPDGQWYTSGVIWAAENGIIAGYGNGLCGPNDSVTIEQLASILYRYSGSPSADLSVLNKYSDISMISDYAKTAMSWAVSKDMTEGAQLHSKSAATRAEAAKMFSIL